MYLIPTNLMSEDTANWYRIGTERVLYNTDDNISALIDINFSSHSFGVESQSTFLI